MDVIFHIDESQKWPMVLDNVKNYVKTATDEGSLGEVEIVANGPAVTETTKNSKTDFTPLIELGVTVAVCDNALHARKLDVVDLQKGITVVPAGVVELVDKQHAGFAYIKP